MAKDKYYFINEDAESCYPLSFHIELAKHENLETIELIEAIPDFDNPDFIWCSFVGEAGEKTECNKTCDEYIPVKGKGCKHKGKLYEYGEKVKFIVKDHAEKL